MKKLLLPFFLINLSALIGCNSCTENEATNKMLALNKVQARMMGDGGEGMVNFAAAFAVETGVIAELIAKQDFSGACKTADTIAKKYKIDLAKEQSGMLTIEQLAKDGGKGTGSCSITDAAQKQMEFQKALQDAITAGKIPTDSLHKFSEKTRRFGEFLTTNPSQACDLLESTRKELGF